MRFFINSKPLTATRFSDDIVEDSTLRSRVFAASDNFIAVLSVGPLCIGHTLIIPRFRAQSIGEVLNELSLRGELEVFRLEIGAFLKSVFGAKTCQFEHGSAGSGAALVGCSVRQAHLHVVPAGVDLTRRLRDYRFEWLSVGGITACAEAASRRTDYLFAQDDEAALITYLPDPESVPHQHLRRVVADARQDPQWDWREFPRVECVRDGMTLIRLSLEKRLGDADQQIETLSDVSPVPLFQPLMEPSAM